MLAFDFAERRTDELSSLAEGEADDRALVIAVDNAELRQMARILLRLRRPHEDLRVLAQLAGHDGRAVLRVHVECGDIVVVPVEEPLLVGILVVDDAERCIVVHDVPLLVVEEVVPTALARGVAEHKPQLQTIGGRHVGQAVRLARIVWSNVVRRREDHPFERVVLERVVEGVRVLQEIAERSLSSRVSKALPL